MDSVILQRARFGKRVRISPIPDNFDNLKKLANEHFGTKDYEFKYTDVERYFKKINNDETLFGAYTYAQQNNEPELRIEVYKKREKKQVQVAKKSYTGCQHCGDSIEVHARLEIFCERFEKFMENMRNKGFLELIIIESLYQAKGNYSEAKKLLDPNIKVNA